MEKDWRYECGRNMANSVFEHKNYAPVEKNNDHDHCEFCGKKFYHEMIDDYCTTEGYVTITIDKKGRESGHWVCKECFNDFKGELNLKLKTTD